MEVVRVRIMEDCDNAGASLSPCGPMSSTRTVL